MPWYLERLRAIEGRRNMKALSLWQPHAQAIAIGLKRYETRDWSTDYRGPIAIHAAKRAWDDVGEWHREARRRLESYVVEHGAIAWAFGAVVATAEIVACRRTSEIRGRIDPACEFWGDFSDGEAGRGRYAFELADVRALPRAVAWRGQQVFFAVELGALARQGTAGALPLFPEE
jgi:hypothetical protein